MTAQEKFDIALRQLPLVAILRGLLRTRRWQSARHSPVAAGC